MSSEHGLQAHPGNTFQTRMNDIVRLADSWAFVVIQLVGCSCRHLRGTGMLSFIYSPLSVQVRNGRLSIIVRDVGPVDPEGPKWRQVIHGLFPSLPVSWLPVYPPAPRPSSTTVHGK